MTRLDTFIAAWTDLRNAVLGRGLAPVPGVPPLLAQRMANYDERFRHWLSENQLKAAFTPVDALPTELGFYVNVYRLLVDEAQAAGIAVHNVMSQGNFEAPGAFVASALESGKAWGGYVFLALLVIGPVVLLANQNNRRPRWR